MKTLKILIADHEEVDLNRLGAVLLAARHQVRLVRNGKDALEQAAGFQPDVCVIDPMVPGIDGFTLSQRLRKKYPAMGIIIATAIYKGDRYRRDAVTKYGATTYLEKPVTDKVFLDTVLKAAGLTPDTPPAPVVKRKNETLPGVPLDDLSLDRTVGVSHDALENHMASLQDQLLFSPRQTPSLIDGIDLDGGTLDGGTLDVTEPEAPPAAPPASPPLDHVRKAAGALEQNLQSPDAHLDKTVADSFARLEQSAAEAAFQREPAFKPADTLITSTISDHGLTAEEIFGGLITDIESGRERKAPPGARPIDGGARKAEDNTQPNQEPLWADTNPDQAPGTAALAHSPDRTDKYELLDLIGEDQAFEIWKAKIKGAKGFERVMALKKIKSYLADNFELNSLFLKEAQLAAALSHPNIVQIYELGEYEGARFLAREFLTGETLQSVFNLCRTRDAVLPPEIAAYLGAKVADALEYAHKARGMDGRDLHIVHHHLSPNNIILTDEGDLKVLNFGTGQVAARAHGTDMVPLEDLQSLAPEQAAGRPLDHRVDIFALGTLLYRALTGVDPFSGTGRESLMLNIKKAFSTPVHLLRQDIPPALSDIVARAMAGEPDRRYQTAADMAADLRAFLKQSERRVRDEEVAAYIRALRAGVAAQPHPGADAAADLDLPPAAVEPPAEPLTPPPVRRRPVHSPPAAPASGGRTAAVGLLILVLILLAAAAAWKFVPRGSDAPAPTVGTPPAQAPIEDTTAEETATDTAEDPQAPAHTADEAPENLPAETDAAADDTATPTDTAADAAEPPAARPIEAGTDLPPGAEGADEPAVTDDAYTDEALREKEEALKRTRDELARKLELLKQLESEAPP